MKSNHDPASVKASDFKFNDALNQELLEKTYRGNLKFANKMFDVFLSTMDSDLTDLQTGFANNDYDLMRRTAHKVKNNFRWVGLPRLSELLTELEHAAREESTSVAILYPQIKNLIDANYNIIVSEQARLAEAING